MIFIFRRWLKAWKPLETFEEQFHLNNKGQVWVIIWWGRAWNISELTSIFSHCRVTMWRGRRRREDHWYPLEYSLYICHVGIVLWPVSFFTCNVTTTIENIIYSGVNLAMIINFLCTISTYTWKECSGSQFSCWLLWPYEIAGLNAFDLHNVYHGKHIRSLYQLYKKKFISEISCKEPNKIVSRFTQ